MLVLSRKPGESIRVGDDIEISIVEVKGDVVRLGIQAPRTVQVWRRELWDAIVAENRKAALETSATIPPVISVPSGGVDSLLIRKKPEPLKEQEE